MQPFLVKQEYCFDEEKEFKALRSKKNVLFCFLCKQLRYRNMCQMQVMPCPLSCSRFIRIMTHPSCRPNCHSNTINSKIDSSRGIHIIHTNTRTHTHTSLPVCLPFLCHPAHLIYWLYFMWQMPLARVHSNFGGTSAALRTDSGTILNTEMSK